MPPAIVASHTYRCVGGDVLYIDFLADETSINVKRGPTGPSLRLMAAAQGPASVGDGMNLTLNGKDIKLDVPKKTYRTCKHASTPSHDPHQPSTHQPRQTKEH